MVNDRESRSHAGLRLRLKEWLGNKVGSGWVQVGGLGMARHRQQPDGETGQRRAGAISADARRDMQGQALNTVAKRGHLENP